MEILQEWFSQSDMKDQELMSYEEMKNLYVTAESYPIENMRIINQSLETQEMRNSIDTTPKPLFDTNHPFSNTFTISFKTPKNEADQFSDPLMNEVSYTTNVPTITRNHVLLERKRREKLNQHFISLSALLPNTKEMDKASVLEDASNYIKQLKDRVNELDGLTTTKMKIFQEYPEIQVSISGSNLLVNIQCHNNISSMVNTLTQMEKLGLSIISSNSIPFAKTTILITIVARIEDDFCMTTEELVKNLQLAIEN